VDTLAHALWTNAVYVRHSRRDRCWAVFFGVAPDLLSFGPFVAWLLATDQFVFRGVVPPPSVVAAYRLTHSLVAFGAVFLLASLWWRRVWWPLWAWAGHIGVDVVTHTVDYFPTPFLYPLSSFSVSGVNWAEPTFVVVNYTLLAMVYLELGRRWRQRARDHFTRR
jgi:hypothetical protein